MKIRWLFFALSISLILLIASMLYFIKLPNFSGFATSEPLSTKPLFSIRMLDFESPVKLRSFLKFSYFIRDVSNISDTAKVSFWLEKDGEIISLGSDTIYLGNLEEKTRTGAIFLPSTMESGVYNFRIRLDYVGYSAESYRVIEMDVVRDVATITQGKLNSNIYFIIPLVLLIILNIIFLYLLKKRNKGVAFTKIKNHIKRHKKIKSGKN